MGPINEKLIDRVYSGVQKGSNPVSRNESFVGNISSIVTSVENTR